MYILSTTPRYNSSIMYAQCFNMRTVWILLAVLLNTFRLIKTEIDTYIDIARSQCGKAYNMGWYKSAYLSYDGSNLLGHNPCSVELMNEETTEYFICVSSEHVSIDCQTKLEFHEHFVKSFYQPEKKMLCHNATRGEWCNKEYVSTMFIVIRKPERITSDSIKLRVFKKERPGGFWRSGINIFLVALLPACVILIVGCSICCYLQARKSRTARARRVQYQTTSGAVTLQTGQGHNTPLQSGACYQPVAHGAGAPQLPSNYQIHTMKTAAPVSQDGTQYGINQPLVPPTAPPVESDEAPPPSYDSLWNKQI